MVRDANDVLMRDYISDGHLYTAPVDAFPPNRFGVYNLSGNAAEWVADAYEPYPPLDTTLGPGTGPRFYSTDFVIEPTDRVWEIMQKLIKANQLTRDPNNPDHYHQTPPKHPSIDPEWAESWYKTHPMDSRQIEFYAKKLLAEHIALNRPGTMHLVKGGSWADRPAYLMPGARQVYGQHEQHSTIGFRVAMELARGAEAYFLKQTGPSN